ncbi:MAG: RidA family protein [Chloroflexi bacterium]|nr:MAG: RidA family protein [Phototrophicales bacterium]RMF80167.1 MAG: RidA family protein [Chloroflexota bacterium]
MRKQITSDKAAPPQGVYSPAIVASGPTLYVSGQGPIDPASGEFRLGTFEEQARLTFDNITTLLEAAGTSWANVVRVGVFLSDLSNFGAMNEIYREYLTEPYPARTTVAAGLPPNMLIEVDCIAIVPE